jgi:hypothetical protein
VHERVVLALARAGVVPFDEDRVGEHVSVMQHEECAAEQLVVLAVAEPPVHLA